MFLRGLPRGDAQCLLEHRVHVRWRHQTDAQLGRPHHVHVGVAGCHRYRLGLLRAGQSLAACLQTRSGTPGFAAGDQHHVAAALLDVEAGLVDQRLGHIAADRGVPGDGIGCADPLRQQQTRVPVPQREHIDDAHRVNRLEDAGIGRLPRRGPHQVHRLATRVLVVLVDLAVADQHRGSGIKGH
ncbi:hypothetical protein A7G45_15230 [Mycolicibacterium llatzerense]|nr:hypothetical protein [Mycolicibacterium llatzerense]